VFSIGADVSYTFDLFGGTRRELEAAESRLRLPNLTTGEIMQLQKQVLDLRDQLHDVPRFSPARAQQP
jgi:hypothetical protein